MVSVVRGNGAARVIVGVDGSLAGLRALRLAVAEARRRGAPMVAVRSWNLDPAWGASPPVWYDELKADAARVIVQAFEDAMGGFPPDVQLSTLAVRSAPGLALVGVADRDDDILFVGAQRHGRLRRLMHRCTARFCAAHARCPVVIVPPHELARLTRRVRIGRAVRRELTALIR